MDVAKWETQVKETFRTAFNEVLALDVKRKQKIESE
jgi:hypothetical protein